MEENKNYISPISLEQDQQLWEEILSGKKSDAVNPLLADDEKAMWENILIGIRARERKKRLKRIRTYAVLGSVTLLLLISGLLGYSSFVKPDIYYADSSSEVIQLRDGSKVTLSKGAKLTVEKSFPADTRDVFLEGDAIFSVSKSKLHPFIVHGNGYETKVLGTVFKVSQNNQTFKVDLYEGKVLVYKTHYPKDPVPLAPKQTFSNFGIYEAASVSETDTGKNTLPKDKSASLTFKDCPISDAVNVIEKTYGIKMHYTSELKNSKITITVPNATAEVFIQTLAIQLNLNTRKNNDSTFELEK